MKYLGWILLAFILGIICAGCAKDRLTVSAYTVQYIENEPVEIKVEYDVFSNANLPLER